MGFPASGTSSSLAKNTSYLVPPALAKSSLSAAPNISFKADGLPPLNSSIRPMRIYVRTPRSFALIVLGLCSVGLVQASTLQCDGNTTEIQACMGKKLNKANTRLAKYLTAAQARIDKNLGSRPNLKTAQAAWVRYRELECGDVFELWAQGTYRTAASSECMLRLTQERTHEIWQAYLTYLDSTPPLLPEPR
jgi:uncharacterized protein YecT (DUF1311 family)